MMQSETGKLLETFQHADDQIQNIHNEDAREEIDKSNADTIQHKVNYMKSQYHDDKLIGYKISLTSKETQDMFRSSTPLYGSLTNYILTLESLKLDNLHAPLIEMKLMLIANEHLTKEDDYASILQKMSIAPGLEIPDSRFTDWFPNLSFGKVIADSAVAGKVIVGERSEERRVG